MARNKNYKSDKVINNSGSIMIAFKNCSVQVDKRNHNLQINSINKEI